ncbi:hypothetical protein ACFQPG_10655 [Sphingomonas sp. GCM10030256]|uniref:hypothetical protein n=1 Tax=Sphingomonas sp. GCM10030256 TaxID=3273427 RepID=UPI0036121777
MWRFFAGVAACFLMMTGAFLLWQRRAPAETQLPEAPVLAGPQDALAPLEPRRPPTASAKSRDEKRFARADKDDDGKITCEELLSRVARPSPSWTRTATER